MLSNKKTQRKNQIFALFYHAELREVETQEKGLGTGQEKDGPHRHRRLRRRGRSRRAPPPALPPFSPPTADCNSPPVPISSTGWAILTHEPGQNKMVKPGGSLVRLGFLSDLASHSSTLFYFEGTTLSKMV